MSSFAQIENRTQDETPNVTFFARSVVAMWTGMRLFEHVPDSYVDPRRSLKRARFDIFRSTKGITIQPTESGIEIVQIKKTLNELLIQYESSETDQPRQPRTVIRIYSGQVVPRNRLDFHSYLSFHFNAF